VFPLLYCEAAPIAASLPPVRREGLGAWQRKNFGGARVLRLSKRQRSGAEPLRAVAREVRKRKSWEEPKLFALNDARNVRAPSRVAGMGNL
jgi:hypothetical protein